MAPISNSIEINAIRSCYTYRQFPGKINSIFMKNSRLTVAALPQIYSNSLRSSSPLFGLK